MASHGGRRQGRGFGGASLGVGLIALCLVAVGCAGDDDEPTADDAEQTTTSTEDAATALEPTEPPAPSTVPSASEPDQIVQASVTIDCRRGESLSELDADLSRITFVPDDAPDDTTWIDIVITIDNPTSERISVDPSFAVSLLDESGTAIANQPWVDGAFDRVYADIVTTEFIIQAEQTSTQRWIVFDSFSGTGFLRDSHELALESLDRCELSGQPDITPAAEYEPPPGVVLELADCVVTPNLALVQAELTATNTSDDAVTLDVYAEALDAAGDRLTTIATFEEPLTIAAGETATRTLAGNAAHIDPSALTECQLYFADLAEG